MTFAEHSTCYLFKYFMIGVVRGPPDSCQSRVLLLHQDFNLRTKFKMMDSDGFIRIKMDLNGFSELDN
jgi:hypothetical protein